MDKISRLFLNQVQILQKQLEHLLEKDPLVDPEALEKPNFQPQTDLSQIENLGLGLSLNLHERVQMIFSRLCLYFESGLLFRSGNLGWRAIAGFNQGDFFPLTGGEIQVPFKFPDMTLIEVRKIQSPQVFSQLLELQVVRNERNQVLIFKPNPEYIFLVTSQLADPWLKPHIERIQKEILMLLGDD
jgi:hypothetical protein